MDKRSIYLKLILLVKAEARWRMNNNDSEALILVNLLRERAKVEPFTSLTAEKLLAERGRELFSEHKRRQDMIRFVHIMRNFAFMIKIHQIM